MTFEPLIPQIAERTHEALALAKADPSDGAVMHFQWCNAAFSAMTGFALEDIHGCRAITLVGPDMDQGEHLWIIEKLMNWESFSIELCNNTKTGQTQWQRMSWTYLQHPDTSAPWWLCSLRDISREKTAELMEEAQKRVPVVAEKIGLRTHNAVEAMDHAFAVFNTDAQLIHANSCFRHLFDEFGCDALQSKPLAALLSEAVSAAMFAKSESADHPGWVEERVKRLQAGAVPYDLTLSDNRILRALQSQAPNGDRTLLFIDVTRERGEERALLATTRTLHNSTKELEEKYSELEEAKKIVEKVSLTDPLTGLSNRRHMSEVLKSRTSRLHEENKPFAALFIDMDRFKLINDTLGHDAGDELIKHVGQVLRDAAKPEDFVARVGGDEFAILTDLTENAVDVSELADGILEGLKQPITFKGSTISSSVSIGVAIAKAGMTDPDQILANADVALYRAKHLGRNRWSFFTQQMHEEALSAKRTSKDLLKACKDDQFKVYYQPQVDVLTGALVGLEALVRWQHPSRGILTPFHFLDIADSLGVVKDIDQMVFRHVAQDIKDFEDLGLKIPKISVNVSGRRLRDPALVHDIRRSGVDPSIMCVEILESIYLDDVDEMICWTIDQLREMGIMIAIDDFGTGHASIQGLLKLEPHWLKIDQQFIRPIVEDDAKASLAHSIVQIGHGLGIGVVAEGVETMKHADAAAGLGCDVLQGYAFARPMDRSATIDYIRRAQVIPPYQVKAPITQAKA